MYAAKRQEEMSQPKTHLIQRLNAQHLMPVVRLRVNPRSNNAHDRDLNS